MLAQAETIEAAGKVAGHLVDKDLTYAALFLATLATGATAFLVKMLVSREDMNRKAILDLHTSARADALAQATAIRSLADSLSRQPCSLVDRGDAYVVLRQKNQHQHQQHPLPEG